MPILLNGGKVTGSTRKFFTKSVTTSVLSTRSYLTTTTGEPTSASTLKSSMLTTTATTATTTTTTTTPTPTLLLPVPAAPVPSSHIFLILGLLILIVLLLIGFGAVMLVLKTRYDRYRLIMTPLYRFDNCQDDLESELLEEPEREPVSHSINGKSRRNFGTCQIEQETKNKPELNLME